MLALLAQLKPLIVPRSYCYRHRNGFQCQRQ